MAERQAQADAQQAQQLADADAAFAEEQARIDSQEAAGLASLDSQYQEEKALRDAAFADQIRQLDASLLGETEAKNRFYQQSAADLQTWLDTMSGQVGSLNANYDPNAGNMAGLAPTAAGGVGAGGAAAIAGALVGNGSATTFSQSNVFNNATDPAAVAEMVDQRTIDLINQYARGK